MRSRLLPALILASALGCGSGRDGAAPPDQGPAHGRWQTQPSGTDADLRGLCAVSADIVWFSGTKGTWGRTTDGGRTWTVGAIKGAEQLDLRDIEAFGTSTAYALSAGPGDKSRIYKTTDGGKSWALQFTNADPAGFLNAIAFWDADNGLALGDPVGGRFQLIATEDGGASWKPLPAEGFPPALPKEGAFAASGTCLVTHGTRDAWFVTGGAKVARVFHSADRGRSWTAHETPVMAGVESAGIFSIAFRDARHGIIVGGDYKKPTETGATAALTEDGGKTWALIKRPLPYRSCAAWASGRWFVVGTSGSDISRDEQAAAWDELGRENYNSVAFTPAGEGWAVGPKGRVARFVK
jgi:photosystem II stability/assembly factor-like uncharacterized protein